MKKLMAAALTPLLLNGCVGLYRPVEPSQPNDELLSCEKLHKEFVRFHHKEENIVADATSITGNQYTEIVALPLYLLNPFLIMGRLGGGPNHKVSEAERSYSCRQTELVFLLKEKSCELTSTEAPRLKYIRCITPPSTQPDFP